jgi:anti-sigma factor RsiW|nr:anti-sigma factor [Rhodoferax sp.]
MDSRSTRPLSDDELHALVDGQVSGAARSVLEERLALEPDAQARVAQWQQQKRRLQGLHRAVLDEAVPSPLLEAARQTSRVRQSADRWWRMGGMAAGVVLSFGMGWLTHTHWQDRQSGTLLSRIPVSSEFVRQARYAHTVYAPEVRHPVEVTAAEQTHLVHWLSKRLGRTLKVPNLSAQGYELVGGRLLPGDTGARAQFMFQNGAGTRLTLYLGAMQAPAQSEVTKETAFRFETDGAVPSFYWVEQGFGYALSGPLQRDALMQLAQAVYQQINQ